LGTTGFADADAKRRARALADRMIKAAVEFTSK
jgi:hypothetical protein